MTRSRTSPTNSHEWTRTWKCWPRVAGLAASDRAMIREDTHPCSLVWIRGRPLPPDDLRFHARSKTAPTSVAPQRAWQPSLRRRSFRKTPSLDAAASAPVPRKEEPGECPADTCWPRLHKVRANASRRVQAAGAATSLRRWWRKSQRAMAGRRRRAPSMLRRNMKASRMPMSA